jgi:aspartate ammonia-lyase
VKERINMEKSNAIKRICSFYVSDLHLITMLFPYLNRKIDENTIFVTISEKSLNSEVKLVLSKLNLKEENKKKLMKVDWNTSKNSEYLNMVDMLKDINLENSPLTIIVNGSKKYIENVNKNIDEMCEKESFCAGKEIKVLNTFNITELDEDIKDILKTHDKILNTSGEKLINEVFEGYEKRYA